MHSVNLFFSKPEDREKIDAKVCHKREKKKQQHTHTHTYSQLLMERWRDREEKVKRKTQPPFLFLSRQEGLVPLPMNSTAIWRPHAVSGHYARQLHTIWLYPALREHLLPYYCHLYNGRGHFYCTLNLCLTKPSFWGHKILDLFIVILFKAGIPYMTFAQIFAPIWDLGEGRHTLCEFRHSGGCEPLLTLRVS